MLAVFAGGDPGDIAKDATEVLHGSKAGTEGYAGDFQLGVLGQLGRLLEPAGVEPLAEGLPGGRLDARRDLFEGQFHDEVLEGLLKSIPEIHVHDIGRQTRLFLRSFPDQGDRLLLDLGDTILKDDNGWNILATLRTVFDEWAHCAHHPARNLLLVGLARWATDTRRRTGNVSAANTAQQFARGETAADLYEE